METLDLDLVTKFDQMEDCLNGVLFERRREVSTAVCALIAGAHHCQIGPPGIAKTMLVDQLMSLISGARYFRWLMTRFTTPEELFGPVSLKGLENDLFRRTVKRKLPDSDVAFLDEFLKCNSASLNALLTMMNEGLYFNGPDVIAVRPIIYSGSNELPRETELAALWDRVTFRHEVKPLRENGSFLAMLKARAARERRDRPQPIITWQEISDAQAAAAKMDLEDAVYEAMTQLRAELRAEGIEPTERRWNDCITIIRATAWRRRADKADVEDTSLLRHVLWMEPGQQPVVDRLVLELANPLDREAMELIGMIETLSGEIRELLKENDQISQRRRRGTELAGKLERIEGDLDKLASHAKKSKRRSDMIEDARRRAQSVVGELFRGLFPDEVDKL